MQDLDSKLLGVLGLAPVVVQGSAINTGDIDLQGFDSALILVLAGIITEINTPSSPLLGTITFQLEHAPDDGTGAAGTYTDVVDADVVGATGLSSGVFLTFTEGTAADDVSVNQIAYIGGKRFIRVTATPTDIGTGGPIAIPVIKGNAAHAPAGATQTP